MNEPINTTRPAAQMLMESITRQALRMAIPLLRIEIRQGNDEIDMRAVGERLGFRVDETLIVLAEDDDRPLKAIVHALHDKPGAAIIVPTLYHLDGIHAAVGLVAQVVTVAGERVLERASADARAVSAWAGAQCCSRSTSSPSSDRYWA